MKVTIPAWKLVDMYKEKHPDGHFFDDKTLKFFGERLLRIIPEKHTSAMF